jgi:serine/threonine protein kinase
VNTLRRAALASSSDRARAPRGELILERYRLLEPLGSGGHGTVWAARDERLRRTVALKRIPRGSDGGNADKRRIDREALAAARLSHPAIVTFYEAPSTSSLTR